MVVKSTGQQELHTLILLSLLIICNLYQYHAYDVLINQLRLETVSHNNQDTSTQSLRQ